MTRAHLHKDSPWLLALLASMVALGPLSIDMYLPAMPAMVVFFDTNISSMSLTISTYLLGFSLGHLLCGPLADRFGRKPVLLAGTGLFAVACIGCSLSQSVEQLLFWRLCNGLGACVGPTLARAITRDIFGPTRAARALSLIAMMMGLAPAVAPTLGGIMLIVLPWSSIFVFLAAYGLAVLILTQRYVPESLPEKQSLRPRAIVKNYAQLISDPMYLTVTITGALSYAGMISYLSVSSFVFIDMLGVPVQYFGLIFLTTVLGYITGSALSARLSVTLSSNHLLLIGASLGMFAALAMWAATTAFPLSINAIMLPMTVFTAGLGLVLPHAMAIALKPFPHIAGTASALMGFIQMSLSALTSALIGSIVQDTPRPMVITLVTISLLCLLLAKRVYDQRQV